MKAEILTIGDEILLGQIVDTNSAWIAQQLEEVHIPVVQISSISDSEDSIFIGLTQAAQRANLIIVTGGLGPTRDDVTKKTAAKYFDTTLVSDSDILMHVEGIFSKLGYEMPSFNKSQAEVLACSEPLFNDVGTAPGMWIEDKGVYYVFLPGVPYEMKYLIENRVLPKLRNITTEYRYIHQYILTVGVGESILANEISDIEESLPDTIGLAYLPKIGGVKLRLSAKGVDLPTMYKDIEKYKKQIAERLGEYVIAYDDISFEEVLIHRFSHLGLTLSTAESCTGGRIAADITKYSGASKILIGSVVAYSNSVKESLLGVSSDTLSKHGAVSRETVEEMAKGVKIIMGSDYAVATSGIAGPTGGSQEKPVGTVWIAVAGKNEIISQSFQFHNDRQINIERSVVNALLLVWQLYSKENKK